MVEINIEETKLFVNENIDKFHQKRIELLKSLKLQALLQKNPYLFRAKNVNKASELIEGTLEAFLSSSEEKMFGDFLEELAIYIAQKTTYGHKSTAPGIDLEFERNGAYYIVSIKSGPNWGNSSQHAKLAQDFRDAGRRLRQNVRIQNVKPILGICYGKTRSCETNQGYSKIVGQNFWTFVSGDKDLYVEIIEPLGYRAKEHNESFHMERAKISNLLTKTFIERFCDEEGTIKWELVVQANSGNYDLDKFKI